MEYNFDINNRAFKAIREKIKKIEIRATKVGVNHFNYGILQPNDIINFTSFDGEKLKCVIGNENWYYFMN